MHKSENQVSRLTLWFGHTNINKVSRYTVSIKAYASGKAGKQTNILYKAGKVCELIEIRIGLLRQLQNTNRKV